MDQTVEISGPPKPFSYIPKASVLVLEDDLEFACLISDYLREVGSEVVSVSNGVEGMKRLLTRSFDAILCDMMMPRMSGDLFYLATERVRPELRARFVFMTGHVSNPKIDYFIEKIGGTLLTKPFTMSALVASIEYVLHVAHLRQALKPDYR